ncbi:MAG: hypothetical protein LDL37_12960 [Asticcacaulis sp.]|uniref:hypothetical protein n=1 Tax=Asticcacaulis sp. TaxID=1872648 RepID=UPI0025BCDD4F|nr:hypothetical protein [Asticcacaulis sp.]MCA1936354.1 hypothetical protein [Asticcacaulis sp.]
MSDSKYYIKAIRSITAATDWFIETSPGEYAPVAVFALVDFTWVSSSGVSEESKIIPLLADDLDDLSVGDEYKNEYKVLIHKKEIEA